MAPRKGAAWSSALWPVQLANSAWPIQLGQFSLASAAGHAQLRWHRVGWEIRRSPSVAAVVVAPAWRHSASNAAAAVADPGALRFCETGIPAAHAATIGGDGLGRWTFLVRINDR